MATLTVKGALPGKAQAEPVECGDTGAVITNRGPNTVYYRDEEPVSASVNDGSLASGSSVTLYGTVFLVVDEGASASRADSATIQITPPSSATSNVFGTGITVVRANGTDDTANVQAALNAGDVMLVNDGVPYNIGAVSVTTSSNRRITGIGRPTVIQTAATLFTLRGGWTDLGSISSLAIGTPNLQDSGESTSTGTTRVTQLSMASPVTVTKGDIVIVVSDDMIVTARDSGDPLNNRFQGEYSQVGVSASATSTVSLSHQLIETYTTNPRLAKLTDVSFEVSGLVFDASTAMQASSNYGATVMLKAARHCRVTDCEFNHSVSRGVVNYTFGSSLTNLIFRNLGDRPSLTQYGYGIQDGGQYTRVHNCHGHNLRHMYTSDAQIIAAGATTYELYGGARYCVISGSSAVDCQHSPFDTHGDSYGLHFSDCKAIGSFKGADSGAVGFTARGRRHRFVDCEAHGCYTGFRITAGGTTVQNCESRATRDQQGLQIAGDTDDAINVTTLEKILVRGGFYETDSSTCFQAISIGVANATYTLDVDLTDVTTSVKTAPSSWRALYLPQVNLTVAFRNLRVLADTATPAGSGSGVVVGGDSTVKVRGDGLQVRAGAAAWTGFNLVTPTGGGTAADVEVNNIDADTDVSALFSTPINATFTNARGSWKTRRSTTYARSSYQSVTAAASLVPATAGRTDESLLVRLVGTAGAVTLGTFATPLTPHPQRLMVRNDNNGTVTTAGPTATIAAAASAQFIWDGSTWRQVA